MNKALLSAALCALTLYASSTADAGNRSTKRYLRASHAVTGAYAISHHEEHSHNNQATNAANQSGMHHYHHHYYYMMPAVPMQVYYYQQPLQFQSPAQSLPPGALYMQSGGGPAYHGGHHKRYPYYSYRRPWYSPGPHTMNSIIVW